METHKARTGTYTFVARTKAKSLLVATLTAMLMCVAPVASVRADPSNDPMAWTGAVCNNWKGPTCRLRLNPAQPAPVEK